MRVLVLALAILLLPLRGWMGDAMAVGIAQQQVAAQAPDAHAGHVGHVGHAGHSVDDPAAMVQGQGASGTAHAHGVAASPAPCDGQATCSSCQLCHSVAVTVWPAVPMLGNATFAAPTFEAIAFASAEPAPGLKPPIS